MAAERLSMRKVREVLRLKHALGMSYRRISAATGVGKTQAADYVHRAALSGITWPVPEGLDDAELERRLFPVADFGASGRPAIDWPAIQCELKRRSVTLALLWQEHLAEHPNGYSYTRFCELYADWRKHVSPTMRQTHLAGEKLAASTLANSASSVPMRRERPRTDHPCLNQSFSAAIYLVHLITRNSFGLMTRKLSVTESQRSAQFRGTFSRRKLSVASANWAHVA
jgi:hypothetical protein